MKHIVNYDNVF